MFYFFQSFFSGHLDHKTDLAYEVDSFIFFQIYSVINVFKLRIGNFTLYLDPSPPVCRVTDVTTTTIEMSWVVVEGKHFVLILLLYSIFCSE